MSYDAQTAAPQPRPPRDPSQHGGHEPEVDRHGDREGTPQDGGATAEPTVDPKGKDPGDEN